MELVNKMLQDPTSHGWDHPIWKDGTLVEVPKVIYMILLDAVYKAKDGITSFGFIMILNGIIVDTGAIKGPKVASLNEAEVRVVLTALEKARRNDFDRFRDLMGR